MEVQEEVQEEDSVGHGPGMLLPSQTHQEPVHRAGSGDINNPRNFENVELYWSRTGGSNELSEPADTLYPPPAPARQEQGETLPSTPNTTLQIFCNVLQHGTALHNTHTISLLLDLSPLPGIILRNISVPGHLAQSSFHGFKHNFSME